VSQTKAQLLDGSVVSVAFSAGSAAAPSVYYSADATTGVYFPGAGQVAISSSGQGRLFIDASGNVGIKGSSVITTSAASAPTFQVGDGVGSPALVMYSTTTGASQISFADSTTGAGSYDGYILYSQNSQYLEFGTAASPRLRITAAGNVGVGTGSPVDILHLKSANPIATIEATGTYGGIALSNSGGAANTSYLLNNNAGLLTFRSNAIKFSSYDDVTEKVRIDSSGRLLVGTTTGSGLLTVQRAYGKANGPTAWLEAGDSSGTTKDNVALILNDSSGGTSGGCSLVFRQTNTSSPRRYAAIWGYTQLSGSGGDLVFGTINSDNDTTGPTERLRIDSSGRVTIGGMGFSRQPAGFTGAGYLNLEGTTYQSASINLINNQASSDSGYLVFGKSRGTAVNSVTAVSSGDFIGGVWFQGADGTNLVLGAQILAQVDGTVTTGSMPGRLTFSTTASGSASPTERLRIDSSGAVYVGTSNSNPIGANIAGTVISAGGNLSVSRDGAPPVDINRKTSDGSLIRFYQDAVEEGNISVSGTTVSYNGAHLSRWSQLPGGAEREEILRGTVLSNIDEMCDWGAEQNEQLNRMQVSDAEGDKNVSGVFQDWDDDDDTYTDDFYCAMSGDFIIRIAEGVTVQRGDLLMSAGDGTAKPQDDDIIRSKTVAKVTSTNVSCIYDDGSYCVPCVLMAC
jgi:hypothetical protein